MSGAKILVVEDEWLVAQGIKENLQDLGYEVIGSAATGEEALRLAEKGRPDLALMDILLQGDMDGIEAAGHLRRQFDLPVIYLTAYADPPTLERAKVTEPYGYILKPFEIRELHSAIEIALYKKQAEKRIQYLTEVLRAIRSVNQLIVEEKDRGRLIQRACQLLTRGRGYSAAWIALAEKQGKMTAFALDGEEADTAPLRRLCQEGRKPWDRPGRELQDLTVIEDLSTGNGGLTSEAWQDKGALLAPLAYQNNNYGELGVLLPFSSIREAEGISLFREIAADLSQALYQIDLEDRQRQIQKKLVASEERFRLLVENAPDAIFIRTDDRFAYLNKEALRLFGASSKEQLLGQRVLDRIHPGFLDQARERMRLVNEGRQTFIRLEQQYLQLDGAPIDVEVSVVPFRYQDRNGALVFARGITARKEAEKTVQEGIHLNQLLLDSLPCVAMLLRPHSREIVAANATAAKVGALPGKKCFATFGQGPEPCSFCLAPEVWKSGQAQHLEVDALGVVWDAHWVPIKEDLYLHYAFDITSRNRIENDRKMLELQLFQAQKLEALGTLAGGIAHDFNNTLGAMLGFAELAHMDTPESSGARLHLENLLKAGERAGHLIKQILSFSRQEKAGRRPLNVTPILKETLRFLRASIPSTIEIRTHFHAGAGKDMVVSDPTQIHQVMMNLTTNAAHAMEAKGGILAVSSEETYLTSAEAVHYEEVRPGPYLKLKISDTGHGMEPAVLERIFEPFYTTKEPGKGTGMGLAVVYGIIKDHKGTIRVTSRPGIGTTFEILFPLVEGAFSPEEPGPLTALPRGKGRILFVDDDENFFQAGQSMLKRLGYEVSAYSGSRRALEDFRDRPRHFDCLICDQTMPGLTGLELAAAISGIRPDLPIILCTGFSEQLTFEKAAAAGVREVVPKPFSIQQINDAINKLIKKRTPETE